MHSKVDQLGDLASTAPILVHAPSQDPLLLPMPTASKQHFFRPAFRMLRGFTRNIASSTPELQDNACVVRTVGLIFQKMFDLIAIRSCGTQFIKSLYLSRKNSNYLQGNLSAKEITQQDLIWALISQLQEKCQNVLAGHYAHMYQHSCRSWITISCHLCIPRAVSILTCFWESTPRCVASKRLNSLSNAASLRWRVFLCPSPSHLTYTKW